MDCSLPASSVHGISQARILEWVAISFSRGFSRPRDWTQVSAIAGRRITIWATREYVSNQKKKKKKNRFKNWAWGLHKSLELSNKINSKGKTVTTCERLKKIQEKVT